MDFERKSDLAIERPAASRQYLTFLLAGEEYAVDILRVREIRGWEGATPIPGTPPYIEGIINLRGAIVPIIDLRERFGMPRAFGIEPLESGPMGSEAPTTVVIVLQVEGRDKQRTMGIVVDAVSDVADVPEGELRPAPDLGTAIDTDFVRGLATVQGKMIIILDVDELLGPGLLSAGIEREETIAEEPGRAAGEVDHPSRAGLAPRYQDPKRSEP